MKRSISLSLTLAAALASQVALDGCSKKEDVNTAPADTAASAPDVGASSSMSAAPTSSAAMDGSASAAAQAASDSSMAASR